MSDKGNGVELATAYVSLTVAMQNQWKTISAEIHKGVEDGAKKARAALEGELAKAKLGGGFGASVEGEAKTGARRARRHVQDQLDGVNVDGLGDKIVGAAKKAAQQARRQLESDLGTIVVNARGDASVATSPWVAGQAAGDVTGGAGGSAAGSALGTTVAIRGVMEEARRAQGELERFFDSRPIDVRLQLEGGAKVFGELGPGGGWEPSIGDKIRASMQRGVDGARTQVNRLQSYLDQVEGPSLDTQLAAAATLVGVRQLAGGFWSLAQASESYQESLSGANVVMGPEAVRTLERWGATAAETAGMSKRAAAEAGQMLGVYGSKAGLAGEELGQFSAGLAQLAGDMASFRETSVEQALGAILAGFRGETEPLAYYAADVREATLQQVALAEGIIDTKRMLTQSERGLAVQAALYQQLGYAMGDFERTSGSLPNQQRALRAEWDNLKVALGQGVAPAALTVTSTLRGAVDVLNEAGPATQKTATQVAMLGTGAAGAVASVTLMAGALERYRDLAAKSSMLPAVGAGPVAAFAAAGVAGLAMRNAIQQSYIDQAVSADKLTEAFNTGDMEQYRSALEDVSALLSGEQVDLTWLERFENGLINSVAALSPASFPFAAMIDRGNESKDSVAGLNAQLEQVRIHLGFLDAEKASAAIDVFAGTLRDSGVPAELVDQVIGDLNERFVENNQVTAAAEKAASDFEAAQASNVSTSDKVAAAIERQSNRLKALSINYQAGDAAAAAFRGSIEASTRMDDQMDAGLALGSAVKALNEGLFGQAKATGKVASASDLAERATTRLSDAVANADGRLAGARTRMEALAAGASTFRQAMADATPWDDQINATLDLGDAFEQMRKQSRRLPAQFDANRASLGRYTQEERTALRSVTSLAAASADYLGTLIETGRGNNVVRSEAARMRGEIERQLRAIGMNEESVRGYINTLGLMPDQVETAIKLSGAEQARFRLQTYLSLLEGKIPAELATRIAAQVEAGDLDGAASTLAKFASSNPVRLDVEVSDESVARAADKMSLPDVYSPLKAALGQYNDEQMRGLEALSKLGDATSNYLATLVADGEFDLAREQAALLRDEYTRQFSQLGLNEDAVNDYLEILGITPDQVETAIVLSGDELAITKIRLYSDLLGDEIPEDVKTEVLTLVDNGSLAAASQVLANWRLGQEKNEVRLKAIIETPIGQGYDGALFNAARRIPGRASGGSVVPGQDYWVGEEGPEIVRFPAAGQVIPADVSASIARNGTAAAGGAAVYNLSVTQVTDASSAPSAFVAELRRLEGERR